MNKKVLGTVLGSCLILCGDYGCAVPRDVVISGVADADAKSLVRLMRKPDVTSITFNGVTKSCSEWEELLKGYKGSGVGLSAYLVTALSRGVSKMGAADISAAKDFEKKRRDERAKQIREYNDKLGENSIIKFSSSASDKKKEGAKKGAELEGLRSELFQGCLTYFSDGVDKNDVSAEVVKALLEKCSDKEKLKNVVENLKRKYYDEGLGGELFVFVVGNDLGMGEVLALEKMLDRSGDKAKLKTGFNKGSTLVALDAFGKDGSKTCKDYGFAKFVELVEGEKIDVSGVVTKAGIESVLVEYREDLSKKEKEKQLKELREKTEGVLGKEKFKKICVDGEGKTDSGKCEIVCKLFTRESFETLSSGLDSESVVKITEYLVGMESKTDRKEVREQIWKDGSYQNSLTGGQVVWGANLSDEGKARLNKDNVVFVLKRPYNEGLDERLAAYEASKAKEDKMKTLKAAYLEEKGKLKAFGLSEETIAGVYRDVLYSISEDKEFCEACRDGFAIWSDSDNSNKIYGLYDLINSGDGDKKSCFLALFGSVYKMVCKFYSAAREDDETKQTAFGRVVKLVNAKAVNSVKLDTTADPAYQIAQAFKALKLCTTKEITKMAIDTVKQYVVDPSVGSKINLDWVSGNIQDNGNVKIGDKEYDGGSFVMIFAHKTFSVTEFNEKDTAEGKQAYLNSVAQGLGVKPVEPEAE